MSSSRVALRMGNFLSCVCPLMSFRRRSSSSSTADILPIITADSQVTQLDTAIDRSLSYPAISGHKIVKEHVPFPFLTCDELASWIIDSRFMFILRGPPGSGKSYIAECIRSRFPTTKICSNDEYWYLESNGVEYQYDSSQLDDAHEWCHNQAYEAAQAGISPLVIDNTNIRKWETRYYVDLAKRFGYLVVMLLPRTPWRFDTETLAVRNVHFISLEAVEAKVRNFEHIIPLYYAWFWSALANKSNHQDCGSNDCDAMLDNHRVSFSSSAKSKTTRQYQPINLTNEVAPKRPVDRMLDWAWQHLITMVELPNVRSDLIASLNLASGDISTQSLLSHWRSATTPRFGRLDQHPSPAQPHVTAFFAGYGKQPNASRYCQSGAVEQALIGCLFTLDVTGLFVTPRTIGLRIRLPNDPLVKQHLWACDDQADLDGGDSRIRPPGMKRPVGCRAHVTLALASDVQAYTTGLDLLRIVDAELNNQAGDFMAVIPGGSVRRVTVASTAASPLLDPVDHLSLPTGQEHIYVYDMKVPHRYRLFFAAAY